MRLADSAGLPLDYRDYATQVRDFFSESMKIARQRKLTSGVDEKQMNDAIDAFAAEAEKTERARQEAISQLRTAARLQRINDALIAVERDLTDARGLRNRMWYTHQIYAPGTYTGYAAQPLPDFRQALDDRNTANAGEALTRIVEALKRAAETLRKARD